jgi:hypothetical protein
VYDALLHGAVTEYFLGDAMGSVRQMKNAGGDVTFARIYNHYCVVSLTSGVGQNLTGQNLCF